MKKIFALASLVVLVATLAVSSAAVLAAGVGNSYGESSDGLGPCLENKWGQTTVGNSYGESSDGLGPCLENKWGQTNN
jgi:hypothetical protein